MNEFWNQRAVETNFSSENFSTWRINFFMINKAWLVECPAVWKIYEDGKFEKMINNFF